MNIPPISFLWRQLNGPQVVAFCRAIFEWFRKLFDPNLNYWSNISIETAAEDYLTELGALAGMPRAVVERYENDPVVFTKEYYGPGSPAQGICGFGFSDGFKHGPSNNDGGRFNDVRDKKIRTLISAATYRKALRAFCDSHGEVGSLVLLDDIMNSQLGEGNPDNAYNFDYDTIAPGDIILRFFAVREWPDGLSAPYLMSALADGPYAPVPHLYISA